MTNQSEFPHQEEHNHPVHEHHPAQPEDANAAHRGHEHGALTPPDPHSGHTMPPQDPHAGHTMPPQDPHAGHTTAPQDPHAGHSKTDHSGHEALFRRKFWVSLLLTIPVLFFSESVKMILGITLPTFPGSQWIPSIFSVIIFIYGGIPFIKMAIPELKDRKPGMMTLISLAISVALLYSLATLFLPGQMDFFWELATLIVIMLLGHWIEMRSIRQASGALDALAKLMPDTAERIHDDGKMEVVAVSELKNGDILLVRPGASIPADGEVVEGETSVNEAMITGESKSVEKSAGATLIGGSINGDGSLRMRVTATGDQTALAGIMRLVAQAQQSKSRTQVLADKAAGWLFYVALGVAILTAIVWTVAAGFNLTVIERVATVLVIACPHALGLAIPLVVAITTEIGAKNGILVRDRLALEKVREVDTVLFDKTGTLTEGRLGMVGFETVTGYDKQAALALAAAAEGDSEHFIARAFREKAAELKLELPRVHGFEAIKGRGVVAHGEHHQVMVGGPRLLEMLRLELPGELAGFEKEAGSKGQSIVHLVEADHDGSNPQVKASFALSDVIRPESRQAVKALQDLGIKVALLTGDSDAVAKSVADELGIDTYFAQVLPENKDKMVSQLQSEGAIVAMVGDGINDAPALTRADIGIAIGSGTDVAVESSGIILVKNNPLDVVKLIRLSKVSYQKMIQNLIWAAGYNVIALPLAAGVLAPFNFVLSPAVGALLMSLSTIIVALNSQLLRRARI